MINPYAPPSSETAPCPDCEFRRRVSSIADKVVIATICTGLLMYPALVAFGIYSMYCLATGGYWGRMIIVSLAFFIAGMIGGASLKKL